MIYRFIESNLESNTEDTSDCKKILEKILISGGKKWKKIYIFILNIFLLVNIVFNTINFYCLTVDEPWFPD